MLNFEHRFFYLAMLKFNVVLAQLVIAAEGGRLQQEQRDR
ncbi:hypothetical protein KP77_03890 [Jeotgalibacillus alimentarius]|uniref:Uncharacterized protein n=1 Tax=Jeotgalibacillus alimentarius TaxID=135826 RepID=A0A0C2WBI4_9BACL|nr:hypothetical protein KP77_03890 [Jeotgalibacillus alimentarius]